MPTLLCHSRKDKDLGHILRANLISVKDETQDAVRLFYRHEEREQHDKICEAFWTDRYCRAPDRSSVIAPLLAGELAHRVCQ